MELLTIKNWKEEDRPREKLIIKGVNALSNAELVAILIGSGNKNETAVELAKRILHECDHKIHILAQKNITELQKFKGIGEAKAISIVTALELGKRRRLEKAMTLPKITCSKDMFEIMQPIIGEIKHEEFWVIHLNNNNKIIEKQCVSKGGTRSTVVDIKVILKRCLELLSSGIIISHNHPSGKLQPSDLDKQLTKKIVTATNSIDIRLLDHVIITEKSYFSFADEGLL